MRNAHPPAHLTRVRDNSGSVSTATGLPDDRICFGTNAGTLIPGNGAVVNYLETSTGVTAINCGKPSATLAEILVSGHGIDTRRACMVGDRLDTDIEFGRSTGMQQLLVLSGVTSATTVDEMVAGTYTGPVTPTVVAQSIAILAAQ